MALNKTTMRFFAFLTLLLFIQSPVEAQKEISLEDIWSNGTFRTKRVPGFNFLQDGKHYTRLEDNQIVQYDLTSGKSTDVIFDGRQIDADYKIHSYSFSSDEKKIILASEPKYIYRRSYTARYMVLNRENGEISPVKNLEKVRYATLNGAGDRIAFVQNNNIFYQTLATNDVVQVTDDGEKNKVINGSADWVYEEEFGITKCFFWSPDGDKLAYIRFDEEDVEEFTMTLYHNDAYPEYETFKYPKVGEKNSVVSVHVYDLTSGKSQKAPLDDMADQYVPRLNWTPNNDKVCIYKMNRHQNHLELLLYNTKKQEIKKMLDEQNKYYIDIHDNLTFINKGKCFIWTSEQDGYNHLYLYKTDGTLKRQITRGKWEITKFFGYDEDNDLLYYQSTERSPLERHIYSIDLKGHNKKLLTNSDGYNGGQFSSTFDYFVHNHSDIHTPPMYRVVDREGKVLRVIEDNASAADQIKTYDAINVELSKIKTEDDVELNMALIKPRDFDPNKKYPLFMYLYGGPGSQQVLNRWNSFRYYWWFQHLANQGYMIAVVDNRGTGGRGEEFKKMTYLQLGKYETIDQINAAKILGQRKYIDKNRIGIYGWSYGGYMSTLCLLKGNDIFKSAIAVAPVTNWKWYDTIYTERYMRTNKENPDGYEENSPINFADRLKGKYLLVHGVADDNVHFQNTVEMANALISKKKQFDLYFYPNRNHGIYGDNARIHLFTKITDFILENI